MLKSFHSAFALALTFVSSGAIFACDGDGSTFVDAIYPSGAEIPENLLRVYLYFDGPMAGDEDVTNYIVLTDPEGNEVKEVFLSNRYDLWSPDRTRLTLLMDPGRVKQNLDAHEELGRAFVVGESYNFTIKPGLKDASGCALAGDFTHQFTAIAADFMPPDPETWQLNIPTSGTRSPLKVTLDGVHDHLSMAHRIRVFTNVGIAVPGSIKLSDSEKTWEFEPKADWSNRSYQIFIAPELEDLAGNRPGQLFDQEIGLEIPMPEMAIVFKPK